MSGKRWNRQFIIWVFNERELKLLINLNLLSVWMLCHTVPHVHVAAAYCHVEDVSKICGSAGNVGHALPLKKKQIHYRTSF